MADSDDYDRAFQRAGEVVHCLTEKVFTDYNQWGLLATHMYYSPNSQSLNQAHTNRIVT
ncbi:MAG: hypothetical protein ABFS56_02275 [Pseudomonadota bacterium]